MKLIYIKTLKGYLLFIIQYVSLGYLLPGAFHIPETGWQQGMVIAGLFLGIWAVFSMRISNLNAGPDPVPGNQLVTRGPYRLIRHPMYAALLLIFIPLVISNPGKGRIAVLALLCINLVLKLMYEEKKLRESFEGYTDYSVKTWRLLPFVF